MASKKEFDLKAKLLRLDEITSLLEGDALSIDESLKLFEEGKKIIKEINTALEEVEEKIEKIITSD